MLYTQKNPKNEIYFAKNSPKKIRQLKTWDMVHREAVVKLFEKIDESEQQLRRKVDIKEWNADGCLGQENKRNNLTSYSAHL